MNGGFCLPSKPRALLQYPASQYAYYRSGTEKIRKENPMYIHVYLSRDPEEGSVTRLYTRAQSKVATVLQCYSATVLQCVLVV